MSHFDDFSTLNNYVAKTLRSYYRDICIYAMLSSVTLSYVTVKHCGIMS